MNKCNCDLCRLGEKLNQIAKGYNLSDEDRSFLCNDIFGLIEGQGRELKAELKKKDAEIEQLKKELKEWENMSAEELGEMIAGM